VFQDATEGEKEKTKVEKTKKGESWTTGKSATMFSAWLSKPTTKVPASESKPTKVLAPTVSDFKSSFRPFAVKKNIDLAPNNYFKKQAETKDTTGKEIIELNDDGEHVDASARPKVSPSLHIPKVRHHSTFRSTFSTLFRFSSPFWWPQYLPLDILQ
jgi:hypothetical protein